MNSSNDNSPFPHVVWLGYFCCLLLNEYITTAVFSEKSRNKRRFNVFNSVFYHFGVYTVSVYLHEWGMQNIYPGTSISSTNKNNRHDITEILLKVALNTINQTKPKAVCWSVTVYSKNYPIDKIWKFKSNQSRFNIYKYYT